MGNYINHLTHKSGMPQPYQLTQGSTAHKYDEKSALNIQIDQIIQQAEVLKDSLLGPTSQLLYALIFTVGIDYATGICVAIHQKSYLVK